MFDSRKWDVMTQNEELVKKLGSALKTGDVCARLLINRGYENEDDARAFIEKSDVFFYDPFLMKDMNKAVDIIKRALDNDDKITIYGDYDVDGVTSVSVLYMYLRDHGARVDYHIPTRDNEGYGLNTSAFDAIKAHGTGLIITVDTGITAIDEVKYAKELGMNIIVTDHHQCRPELPEADAVVNPKRSDCPYPFKELSGVGVVFKIICALELDFVNGGEYNLYTIKDMCRRYIDLVTIGTIADVMPLTGENRIIVYMGLGMLQNVRHVGIRALFRASGIIGGASPKKITSSTISFTVAPKINAVGRIGSAERAVKLFLTDSPTLADVIADELCSTNKERQEMENIIYKSALDKIETQYDKNNDKVMVLSSDDWHHGVIGIVASRITEKFGLPAVLISSDGVSPDENGRILGKGSVRSVKGINIVEALASCSDILPKFGGHALAAGLSVYTDDIPELRRRLNDYISNIAGDAEFSSHLKIDAEIPAELITEKTVEEISLLEPCGAGNPVPLFVLRNAEITEMFILSGGKHTKLVMSKNGCVINGVMFGSNLSDEGFAVGDAVDVVCSMDINEFRGERSVQLIIRDIDHSANEKEELISEYMELSLLINDPNRVESCDIPNREDFVKIYTELKNINGNALNFREFAARLGDVTYIKLAVALKAFGEAGLIETHENKDRIFMSLFKINKVEEKCDLFATPIMRSLKI